MQSSCRAVDHRRIEVERADMIGPKSVKENFYPHATATPDLQNMLAGESSAG